MPNYTPCNVYTANSLTAIEYIQNTQQHERQLQSEVQRLQREFDYAQASHKENELLRTEVRLMHQALRHLNPSAPHVYGQFTSQLSQVPPPHTNGVPAISLPPLNSQTHPPPFAGGPPPAAAMQGIEYGGFGGR